MNKPVTRFLKRSVSATAIGWLVPPAVVYLFPMSGTLISGPTGSPAIDGVLVHVIGYIWFAGMMAFWVVPSWLLLVLPLTLIVPLGSKFWHPVVVGVVGLVAGGAVLVGSIALITRGPGELQIGSLLPLAGLGGAVGFVTGLALSYFIHKERNRPNKSVQTTAIPPPPSATPQAPLSDL